MLHGLMMKALGTLAEGSKLCRNQAASIKRRRQQRNRIDHPKVELAKLCDRHCQCLRTCDGICQARVSGANRFVHHGQQHFEFHGEELRRHDLPIPWLAYQARGWMLLRREWP